LLVASSEITEKRQVFFKILFRESKGFICIASRENKPKAHFEEKFFRYTEDLETMLEYINIQSAKGDVWFSPMLYDSPRRAKDTVLPCLAAWADLDQCHPDKLMIQPSITLESSPGRYQALWRFTEETNPYDAEDISKRIAYYHADEGVDKSGWDLTQLLRVPLTANYKYIDVLAEAPIVNIFAISKNVYELEDFKEYPIPKGFEYEAIPFPTEFPEGGDASKILDKYRLSLPPEVTTLVTSKPLDDWSKALWRLEMLLAEGGLTREEIFVIAANAACNKYKRDDRSEKLLWREVCKAYSRNVYQTAELYGTVDVEQFPPILNDRQRAAIKDYRTFVDDYYDWACSLGDAAKQYHVAGGFILLSSLLSGSIALPTSFGTVYPNLWFMILADTTLTRKSTAMDIAVDLLNDVDPEALLATDGSIEGLLTSLSVRPGRPSLFLRDEFSGLLEQMSKKDYYAGMAETLTKLYDGKYQKRILRKETLEVRDPVMLILAGGIKGRIQELLTYDHVSSGFLPRFIFITAESDTTNMKPLGPPTDVTLGKREQLVESLLRLHSFYAGQKITIDINGKANLLERKKFLAQLTPEAWKTYNEFEQQLLTNALKSYQKEILTPSVDRLSKSALKVAVLLSATRKMTEEIIVEEIDILKAFAYAEEWGTYLIEVLHNIGKGAMERKINNILSTIRRSPYTTRSAIMRAYHLTRYDADQIFDTLEQRGLIIRVRSGKTERITATR